MAPLTTRESCEVVPRVSCLRAASDEWSWSAVMASSDVRLDGGEAVELAELLSFLGDWLLIDDEVGRFVVTRS